MFNVAVVRARQKLTRGLGKLVSLPLLDSQFANKDDLEPRRFSIFVCIGVNFKGCITVVTVFYLDTSQE